MRPESGGEGGREGGRDMDRPVWVNLPNGGLPGQRTGRGRVCRDGYFLKPAGSVTVSGIPMTLGLLCNSLVKSTGVTGGNRHMISILTIAI